MTPHELTKILREGTTDYDVVIDINAAFSRISKRNQEFLNLYSSGYSVRGAAQKMQLRDNPQRLFNRLIKAIIKEVNGATDSTYRTNVQREDHSSKGA